MEINKHIAVVRIRGNVKIKTTILDTLKMLRLYNKHYCVVIPNKPEYMGMLKKVQSYVTWGEINQDTFVKLVNERGRLAGNKRLDDTYVKQYVKVSLVEFVKQVYDFKKQLKELPGVKMFFRLKPPEKGYERKGTKEQFSLGGALGYRKDKINELLLRMI